jgi:hypothetical protein
VKSSDDFLQYATYLKNVYKLIGKRRAAIKYTHKRDEIEDVINLKIDNVYRRVCERFPVSFYQCLFCAFHLFKIILFLARNEIMEETYRIQQVAQTLFKCQQDLFAHVTGKCFFVYSQNVIRLQLHNSDVSLWREAAEYEYRTRLAVGSARNLLQSALRVHKKSIELYTALLDIELSFVDKFVHRISFFVDAIIFVFRLIERRNALKAKIESKATTSQNDDGMDEPIVDYTDVDDLSTTAQDAVLKVLLFGCNEVIFLFF